MLKIIDILANAALTQSEQSYGGFEVNDDDGFACHTNNRLREGVTNHVSTRTSETVIEHRRCAAFPKRHSKPEKQYVRTYKPSKRCHRVRNPSAFQTSTAEDTAAEMDANIVNLQEDLDWLNLESETVLGLLYPETKIVEETKKTVEDEVVTRTDVQATTQKNEPEKNARALETLPELDEDDQTSESGLSAAEELVNQYLNSFPSDIGSPLKRSFDGAVHIASETCSSRFSWNSSSESLHEKLDHEAWWRPIKPLSIRRKHDEAPPPPIPERNPLRLLQRLNKDTPQGYGNTARRSRNIRNLYLDLVQPDVEEITPFKTIQSHRRRSNMQESHNSTQHGKKEKLIERSKTTNESTSTRKQERDTRNAAAWQSIHYGTKVRPRPRSIVKDDTHRRTQSVRETSKSTKHSERAKGGRGHVRGASEPCDLSITRRGSLSKWDDAMPTHGSSKRSCTVSHKKDGRLRAPKLPYNINKKLPALPSAGKTPGWQFVEDLDD